MHLINNTLHACVFVEKVIMWLLLATKQEEMVVHEDKKSTIVADCVGMKSKSNQQIH